MKKIQYFASLLCMALLVACQPNMDVERTDLRIATPDTALFAGAFLPGEDYNYELSWTYPETLDSTLNLQLTVYRNGAKADQKVFKRTDTSYQLSKVETNEPCTFVFKYTDGEAFSLGAVKHMIRLGANAIEDLKMEQVENEGSGYDVNISWKAIANADSIVLHLTESLNGKDTVVLLAGEEYSYTIADVKKRETWAVTAYALNVDGRCLSKSTSLLVGNLRLGFLSEYATPEEHLANADDDEQAAWIWFHKAYPEGTFMPFASIEEGTLDRYRVLFWLRDLTDVPADAAFEYSADVEKATRYIREWAMDGGSMLLWQHAATFVEKVGRIPSGTWRAPGTDFNVATGIGGINNDTWPLAVSATPNEGEFVVNFYDHPLYKGLTSKLRDGGAKGLGKVLPVKGPGYTEDHNCLFHNYPGKLTGLGNQDPAIYQRVVEDWGIVPLGTWDGQMNWIGQLNVWEARPCINSEYLGTFIMIGNGGLEFAMNNPDGSADNTMSVNCYQETILTIAKNAIEYLRTR